MRAAVLALLGALCLRLAPPVGAQTFTDYLIDHYAGPPPGVTLAGGAEISGPYDLVLATDGTWYVTEILNHRVLKVTPDGVVSRVAGRDPRDYSSGSFSGDGGPATSAALDVPTGLALDRSETRLYIADYSNHRVRKVDLRTGVITTVAGTGTDSFSGDGGPATAATLDQPEDMAVATDGSVYLTDAGNNRIRKIAPDGTITTIAGTGTDSFSGDDGPATAATLNSPTGLALNRAETTLYVADYSNHRIRAIDLTATPPTITTVWGGGQIGTLNGPAFVAVDRRGTLYVTELDGHRVQKLPPGGTAAMLVAGTGTACRTGLIPCGDGGPATAAQLNQPAGIAVTPTGTVYIANLDTERVRAIGTDGIIRTVLGTGRGGYATKQRSFCDALPPDRVGVLASGPGLPIAPDGTLYWGSRGHVCKLPPGGPATLVAGQTDADGWHTRTANTGDDGPATEATFSFIRALALTPDGRTLYIGTSSHLRAVDLTAQPPQVRAVVAMTGISNLAVGADGTVYAGFTAVNPSTGTVTTIAGGGSTDLAPGERTTDPTSVRVGRAIESIAIASDDTLYVATERDQTIGSTLYSLSPDRTTLTRLEDHLGHASVNGLAVSRDGKTLYATDRDEYAGNTTGPVVRAIDLTTVPHGVRIIAGHLGVEGNSGDGGLAPHARLNNPGSIAVGPDGRIYVADDGNHRIRVLRRITLTVGTPGSGTPSDDGTGTRRRQPTDHHGDTPATATAHAPTARASGFLHYGDQDYFQLDLPHAGLLLVQTSGWANTVCTVWQDSVELGTATLGGRLYNCRLGVPVQAGPVTIRVTEQSKHGFGSYGLATRFIPGQLDPPLTDTPHTGLGVLTGWVCSPDAVVLEIDGQPYQPAPLPAPTPGPPGGVVGIGGTPAPPPAVDPRELCGDTATGFGLPVNWNLLGDGEHTLVARLHEYEFARATVQVTTLGEEFVRDAQGTCVVPDFPLPAHTVTLVWQEAGQHFALTDGSALPPAPAPISSTVLGHLETPAPTSFQSGWGSITGWVCDAEEVGIEINDTPYPVAYGTERADTAAVCGEEATASGFGLRLNWNALGPGDHEVVAVADGEIFGRATVRVTTLGGAFMRGAERAFVQGLAGECVVDDFPAPGESVRLEWQPAPQNFVMTEVR